MRQPSTRKSYEWREMVPLTEIRPTQMAVGMQLVETKRQKVERHIASGRRLRSFLEKRPVPAVLGPDEDYYIIDHHHLSLALWQCEVDEVVVRVISDMSELPKRTFLRAMAGFGWLHAYDAQGRKTCPSQLPQSLDALQPDCYRDLAWAVRRAGGYRKSYIPFSEFAWANFFREHIPVAMLDANFEHACDHAVSLARTQAARHLPGCLYAS